MRWIEKPSGKRASQMRTPLARTDELVLEDVGDEVLIYDQVADCAHCLSRDAARVWRCCDGKTSVEALGLALDLDRETVARALEELADRELLQPWRPAGVTRREVTLRLAKVGAAAASVPLIYSIVAPTPALATSQAACLGHGCVQDCGICHQAGCSCCGPGNSTTSADKICTQDCTTTFCNDAIRGAHCGTISPSNACN